MSFSKALFISNMNINQTQLKEKSLFHVISVTFLSSTFRVGRQRTNKVRLKISIANHAAEHRIFKQVAHTGKERV